MIRSLRARHRALVVSVAVVAGGLGVAGLAARRAVPRVDLPGTLIEGGDRSRNAEPLLFDVPRVGGSLASLADGALGVTVVLEEPPSEAHLAVYWIPSSGLSDPGAPPPGPRPHAPRRRRTGIAPRGFVSSPRVGRDRWESSEAAGEALPADSFWLGQIDSDGPRSFRLPLGRGARNGNVVLYDLDRGRVVAAARVGPAGAQP